MAKFSRRQGSVSQIFQVFVQDSSSSVGAGLKSLTPGTPNLALYYHKDSDSNTGTAVTLTTMTIGTYKSGGFAELNQTNLPGMYQVCFPNAAFAVTAASVVASLRGATNMADLPIEIDLDAQVDVYYWNGSPVATPNTAGVPAVDVTNVSGSSVSTSLAQFGVNVVNILGSPSVGAAGYVGTDQSKITNTSAVVNLAGTQIGSVNNLASGTDSVNTVATSGSTLTTGSTVSGSYLSTQQRDGTYWQISDTAGTLDMYFEFNVGSTGVPTSALWVGGLTTVLNTLKVFAFNWAGSSWDQLGTVSGTNSLVVNSQEFNFTTAHVGTGGNLGLVRLRFQNTGLTTANFYTDYVICGYTNVQTFPINFNLLAIDGSGDVTYNNAAPPTAIAIASSVWTDATGSDFQTVSSIGLALYVTNKAPGTSGGHLIAGNNSAVTVAALTVSGNTLLNNLTVSGIATVTNASNNIQGIGLLGTQTFNNTGTWTGNLSGSVGSVAGSVNSVNAGVTVSTNADKTGYSVSTVFDKSGYSITSNIKKNQALNNFEFLMTDSVNHAPSTGLVVTVTRSVDGGAFAAGTLSAVSEISNGMYAVNFGAGDLNGSVIVLQATAAGSDTTFERVVTQP